MNKCIATLFLLGCSVPAFGQSAALTETPKPADSLVDSMGVNLHMSYSDSGYNNVAAVKQMLATLAIRHVRDGAMYYPADPGYGRHEFSIYGELASQGISFDLIVDFRNGTDPNPMTPGVMAALQADAAANGVVVDSYEGANEVDNHNVPDWAGVTRNFEQALYSAKNANPTTANIVLVGNSLSGPSSDWALLGNMTAHEDFGNLHPYANTQYPSFTFPLNFGNAAVVSGSQRVVVTESGWSNALNTRDNSPNVNEEVAGRYMGRLFFETMLRGCPRTYVYELLDERPDAGQTSTQEHFGLFRSDFSPKPAATVIGNISQLLSDKNQTVNTAALSYTLTTSSGAVHHLLFRKHDGSYWLALWQEVSGWRGWNAQGSPITNADQAVTLSFPSATSAIQTFRPNDSVNVVTSYFNQQSVTLMVPDEVLLVKISKLAAPNNLQVSVK